MVNGSLRLVGPRQATGKYVLLAIGAAAELCGRLLLRGSSSCWHPGALTRIASQVPTMAVDSFTGKLAVMTGGGSGIGRQLPARDCSAAACDLNPGSVAVTAATAWAAAPPRRRGHRPWVRCFAEVAP